jgi:hypothetical protein
MLQRGAKPTSGKEVAFLQMIFWTKSRTLDLERTTTRFSTLSQGSGIIQEVGALADQGVAEFY